MVCEPHEPDLDIGIPAIMLPQHAGTSLIRFLGNSSSGESRGVGLFFFSSIWEGWGDTAYSSICIVS